MASAPLTAEVVELLASVPVFSTLEPDDMLPIASLAVPRSFEQGQVVFRKGDASDTCYVVRSGHVRAVREHPDGRIITLATFGPGDIFGELAMFEDERRSATIETLEATTVVAILGPDMRRLMATHPTISTRLVVALGRRLRESNERLARQSFQTVQSRVALVLAELVSQAVAEGSSSQEGSSRDGVARKGFAQDGFARRGVAQRGVARRGVAQGGVAQGGSPRDVELITTQAAIAQLAGSSRESASRFLAVLERAGVISQGRGRLVVHNPDALDAYVY